jgi:pimeloyl-ACP methyl ester carboxylesterase
MPINQPDDLDIIIPDDQAPLSAKLNCVSEDAPLIILMHGFCGDKDEKGLFSEAAGYFCAEGYSVLRFDFRYCGANSGSFKNVRFFDLENDLNNALNFVRTGLSLKPKFVGVVGFSLGATIAILANSKAIKAYALWSPAIFTDKDMYPRYATPEISRDVATKGFFIKSGIEVGPGFLSDLRENSIRAKIPQISKPVLLVHGENDSRIPVSSTKEASLLFRRRPKLCLIPGADHSFRQNPIYKSFAFTATAKFFDQHIQKRPITERFPLPLFGESPGDLSDNSKQSLQS